jgi:myosin-18
MIRNTGMMTSSSSSSTLDTQSTGLGLLWLLEEELLADSKSTNNFMRKLMESDRRHNYFSINNVTPEEDINECSNFTIYHQFGENPVEYNSTKWLQTCKDYSTIRNALILLQESKRDAIIDSFVNTQFNTYTDIGSGSSLKRQASVRKMLTMSKKKTFIINLKLQLDSLFDSLRRTRSNFVFCFVPSSIIKISDETTTTTSSLNEQSSTSLLDVPFLRNQLKAYQVLAACRIYRQGFPDSLTYDEFKRRYSMLTTSLQTDCLTDSKQACTHMIKSLDFELTQYKLGLNKIFFKAGILNKLEDQREEKINDLIKRLQCHARTYLAQRSYERKKVEIAAIKCIQNNIRKHFILKKWPWWKLYTNLMPLVNMQNNETLVKQYKDELDDVKRKFDRLINEKNDLKLINNQLETKLMNLQTEYVEEHAANAGTIDLLEVETSERMRLERELNEVRLLYNDTVKKVETVEGELFEYRAHSQQRDDIDGLSNNNQTLANNNDEIYQYRRDYDFLKQQFKQDKEGLIEQNEQLKLNYENKFKELSLLNDNYDSQLSIYKRKYQKLQEEIQDTQRFNDEFKTRNKELERVQSKYDSDMHDLKQELENEINLREKYQREKDQLQYEMYNLKADLENLKLDLDLQKEKSVRLDKDLKEYENTTVNGNSDNGSQVIKMKSQVREMEIKMRDQEEELDDQAATIQQLEQFKLKLEMQLEKEKQKLQREIAEKESEMDDLRFHTQKKIKSIEIQLEEESEINSSLQREKRELERKIRELENSMNVRGGMSQNDYEYVSKLKRQLQKYKALAIDAQSQLERLRDTNLPKQASVMKALRLQLEDSELNRVNVVKAKQMMHGDIIELQSQVDDLMASKQHVEEHNIRMQHEINDLKSQLDEQERESDEILKKYQNQIQNFSLDSNRFIDLNNQIDLLTIENRILKDKLRELEEKTSYYETTWIDKACVSKFESKIRDLECKLDLEMTYKSRVQNQLDRLKQQYDKCLGDCEQLACREKKTEDGYKRINRHNKETMEEIMELKKKLNDYDETRKRLVSVVFYYGCKNFCF